MKDTPFLSSPQPMYINSQYTSLDPINTINYTYITIQYINTNITKQDLPLDLIKQNTRNELMDSQTLISV